MLRMLSRFYDMPFRKDIIKKILNNQATSTKGESIPHQGYAAILDLMGLRTVELLPNTEQLFARLPYPALHSLIHILWSYGHLQDKKLQQATLKKLADNNTNFNIAKCRSSRIFNSTLCRKI